MLRVYEATREGKQRGHQPVCLSQSSLSVPWQAAYLGCDQLPWESLKRDCPYPSPSCPHGWSLHTSFAPPYSTFVTRTFSGLDSGANCDPFGATSVKLESALPTLTSS